MLFRSGITINIPRSSPAAVNTEVAYARERFSWTCPHGCGPLAFRESLGTAGDEAKMLRQPLIIANNECSDLGRPDITNAEF
jgi:hypothetical protein